MKIPISSFICHFPEHLLLTPLSLCSYSSTSLPFSSTFFVGKFIFTYLDLDELCYLSACSVSPTQTEPETTSSMQQAIVIPTSV